MCVKYEMMICMFAPKDLKQMPVTPIVRLWRRMKNRGRYEGMEFIKIQINIYLDYLTLDSEIYLTRPKLKYGFNFNFVERVVGAHVVCRKEPDTNTRTRLSHTLI